MGQGLCADAQGEVINYYGDGNNVPNELCEQHCTEIGETCIGFSDFDRGAACLLHVSEQTETPTGFHYSQPNSNEANSVQTVNTEGSHWGHPKTDFSCFKKIATSISSGNIFYPPE